MPRRRHTKALATDSELEFEFFLAHELKTTLSTIRLMDNAEFIHWAMYFGRIAQKKELAKKTPMRAKRRR